MKKFKAESQRLLDLMINSIYTNKDIFLRELISNASDAMDKMYYKSLEDPDIEFNRDDFYIMLEIDKDNRILKVSDHGKGMTQDELVTDLGTIAKSGSFDFKNENEITEEDVSIIGQFGVGFYSGFMVADKIEVLSKAYGEDEAYIWVSSGSEGYEINKAEKDETGSTITLHIREGEEYDEYLQEYKIRGLVEKYSNYIKYPIKMEVSKTREVEVEPEVEGEEKKTDYETYKEVEVLNSMIPIWKKNRNELKDEDYINFYKDEHFGFDDPLLWTHLVADGTLSYRSILYVPSKAPFDYYTKEYKKGLELYSNGVMIMENCEELLPDYYSFVKGVVDSEDISLNISRETVQQNKELRVIGQKIESKITDELKKLLKNDRDKYVDFFDVFGNQIKAGIYQSYGQLKGKLQDLLIFESSKGEKRTLKEYVEDMKEDQEKIYYASGESVNKISKNPGLEYFKDKDIEVFYLVDTLDEFVIQMMMDYEDKEFKSAFSEDIDVTDDEEKTKDEALEHNESEVLSKMKEILKDEVVDVRKSKRLKEGAIALVSSGPISIEMEKTFQDQPDGSDIKAQKVLEINVDHPVFERLLKALGDNDNETFEMYTKLLYNQSRLIVDLPIDDPVEFSKNILKLM